MVHMPTGDIPTISAASHAHTAYGLSNLGQPLSTWGGTTSATGDWFEPATTTTGINNNLGITRRLVVGDPVQQAAVAAAFPPAAKNPKPKEVKVTRRLVQVFIADPDENVSLDDSLLYSGEQKLTDLTDQELFFEIDIKSVLAAHNDKRTKTVNKKVKERTEYLDPAKIRDLKMVVVTVANF